MHEPVQSNIEDYLSGSLRQPELGEVESHLRECPPCQTEIAALQAINEFIHTLKPAAEIEPRANFYARVMERIESQVSTSFWNFFLDPGFGRTIGYASVTLVALVGTYWFSLPAERGPVAASEGIAIVEPDMRQILSGPVTEPASDVTSAAGNAMASNEPDRDAVLVNLVSYTD